MNYKTLSVQGRFSSVWLTANNKFDIESLTRQLDFKDVIIDATNRDYKIAAFKIFAANNKLEAHVLKKNPAYLIYLTQ
ncbi:MAG: hypothetical protein EOO60_09345 [Hymenobacter sp.]|nr:MAG: hypothetical protein EOO60_09345 [Hymenobacter sp.]